MPYSVAPTSPVYRPPVIPLALPRGVHYAGYQGDAGELVLVAVRGDGRLASIAPLLVPVGSDGDAEIARLWATLDREDPPVPPRLRLVPAR